MKKFMLFVLGLVALAVLIGNLGPMIVVGVGVWLLYVIYKKFVKANSTGKKIGWVILGLMVLSITISNSYALMGIVAAYGLYLIYKEWKADKHDVVDDPQDTSDNPFINFEKQWAQLNN